MNFKVSALCKQLLMAVHHTQGAFHAPYQGDKVERDQVSAYLATSNPHRLHSLLLLFLSLFLEPAQLIPISRPLHLLSCLPRTFLSQAFTELALSHLALSSKVTPYGCYDSSDSPVTVYHVSILFSPKHLSSSRIPSSSLCIITKRTCPLNFHIWEHSAPVSSP